MDVTMKILRHFNMRQDILRIGQAAFLLAIKEFERIEMYEYCQFAKDQVESYCKYYRIELKNIENQIIDSDLEQRIKVAISQ